VGRPRKSLPANGIDVIRRLAANGVNEHAIAGALGLSYETWQRIRAEDPEAKAAWQEARAIEENKLVGVLYRKAIDQDDTVAAIFLLKARHGYRDIGPTDGSSGVRTAIQINLPGALKAEDYTKLVTVTSHKAQDAEDVAA
jgi:hypothetical protein